MKCKQCLTYIICRNKLTTLTAENFDDFLYYRYYLIDCFNNQIGEKCSILIDNYKTATNSYGLFSNYLIDQFDLDREI